MGSIGFPYKGFRSLRFPYRFLIKKGGFPEKPWGFPYKGDAGLDGISKLRNSGNPVFPLGSNS
jgi:hypothetical protein